MRVLFLTPTLGIGGAERLVSTYALGMERRGHRVGVAYGVSDGAALPMHGSGIELCRLTNTPLRPKSLREWVRVFRALETEFRPDVVHAQSVTAALVARLASAKVPLLVTVHGISRSDEPMASLLLRAANVKLTAVSEASAVGLRRHVWAPPIEVLSPGVDVEQTRMSAAQGDPVELIGRPSLCCAARLEEPKGVDVLIRALALLDSELPEAGVTVCGSGTLLEPNKQLAAERGVGDRVRFSGLVPNAAPYLAAADIVVLPSRREGLPVVALEALALERPVVATRVGGIPTVVIDGETGWLAPPEDERALAAAIVACASDPEEAARRAQAGRRLVEEQFGVEPMLARIEDMLLELSWLGSRVPGTKPKPYYRAARLYQRARIEAARFSHLPAWEGVRIFGYHRVADDKDVYAVSPRKFREHMELIAASGATPIRLDAALDLLETPVEGRYVCVTFDDGYRDVLEHGLPVLEDLQIPATIFVITDVLEGRRSFDWHSPPPPALSVDDIPSVLASGLVDLQAHSMTHPRLTAIGDDQLEEEVAGAKVQLETHLPYRLTSFAYPAGLYGQREVAAVLAAGFRAGISTNPGVNPGGEDLGELRRTMIRWRDRAADLEAKLAGALDQPSRLELQRRRARLRRRFS
jgi:glycosyltransferase involved in cell wall biosynthesis/peptidoglycan/xylan/chitin deacetylase (PgdA/CDA1 family)